MNLALVLENNQSGSRLPIFIRHQKSMPRSKTIDNSRSTIFWIQKYNPKQMQSFVQKSLLALACFMAAQTVFAQTCSSTLEQEYQALMALYQSTNGANWTNKTGW